MVMIDKNASLKLFMASSTMDIEFAKIPTTILITANNIFAITPIILVLIIINSLFKFIV